MGKTSVLYKYTHYELSNHLGNVLAVITDRKLISTGAFYVSDVLSLTDYYAFGQAITERTYNASAYRYSINGQEKDTDIDANHTTALYWEYDSRTGRRWNLDPKPHESVSPFACFGNNPIGLTDVLGDSIIVKNQADQENVLDMIHQRAKGEFKFDGRGRLQVVSDNREGGEKNSKHYTDKLKAAISSKKEIEIQVSQTTHSKNNIKANKKGLIQLEGEVVDIDKIYNGGLTHGNGTPPKAKILVVITGNYGNFESKIKDKDDKVLNYEAADVLMHELLGHAIARILGGTGDAIKNENIARKEMPHLKERRSYDYDNFPSYPHNEPN